MLQATGAGSHDGSASGRSCQACGSGSGAFMCSATPMKKWRGKSLRTSKSDLMSMASTVGHATDTATTQSLGETPKPEPLIPDSNTLMVYIMEP